MELLFSCRSFFTSHINMALAILCRRRHKVALKDAYASFVLTTQASAEWRVGRMKTREKLLRNGDSHEKS